MTEITKTNSTDARSALAAAHYLRAVMQGNVLLPGDRAYTSRLPNLERCGKPGAVCLVHDR